MTDADRVALPPDPEKYDAARNVAARRRGLAKPYIAGGEDPDLARTLERERPYVRILVGMVVLIIATGFILGFVAALLTAPPA